MNEDNNNYVPQQPNNVYNQPNGSVIPPNSTVMVMQPDGTLVPQDASAMILQADGTYISAADYAAALQQQMSGDGVIGGAAGEVINDADIIYCAKCGDPMKRDARYCLRCGNLNYSHPDNLKMKNYAWQSVKKGEFISGINVDRGELIDVPWKYRYKPFLWCFIVNFLIHLALPILLNVFANYANISELSKYMWAIYIGFAVLFVFDYSMQSIFIKAKERWWSYFIPIYSQYVFFDISAGAGWMFILLFIPFVNIVVMCYALFRLGRKFGKSGLATMLLPFVMIPIIGLGSAQVSSFVLEPGITQNEVDSKGRTRSEREYKRKKIISSFLIISAIAVVGYIGWPYIIKLVTKIIDLFTESLEFFQ